MVTVVASVVQGLTVSAQSGFTGCHAYYCNGYICDGIFINIPQKKTMLLAIIGIAAEQLPWL